MHDIWGGTGSFPYVAGVFVNRMLWQFASTDNPAHKKPATLSRAAGLPRKPEDAVDRPYAFTPMLLQTTLPARRFTTFFAAILILTFFTPLPQLCCQSW